MTYSTATLKKFLKTLVQKDLVSNNIENLNTLFMQLI